MNLTEIFSMHEYPIYLFSDIMGCTPTNTIRLIKKYKVPTFKRNGSRFILRDDIIWLVTLPNDTCSKYLSHIKQNY
jgi:hypothetical protein